MVLVVLVCARSADAQTWQERVWAEAGGGIQAGGTSFSDTFDIHQFAETGSVETRYPAASGATFEGGAGVRVWKRFGAGVAVTRASSVKSASVSARIPHPFFDDRFRDIEGAANVPHDETDVHVQFSYLVNLASHVRMILSAGPSVIDLDQTFVTDVQYSQEYPYDTATYTGATTHRSSANKVGFNVSADGFWMFSRQVGAGGLVRFTRATVAVDTGTNRSISVDAGGVQATVGLRFLF
jgi:hypothetical protein